MARKHPDDIQLILTYAKDASGAVMQVDLDGVHADSGDDMFRLSFTPAVFARLMASGVVRVRSTVAVPRLRQDPDCGEDNYNDHGDCDGKVREYAVTGDNVCGRLRGETVMLCASHASYHGQKIRRQTYAGRYS